MKNTPWFFHPITVFVFSIAALVLSLFLYIYWYIEISTGLENVVNKFNLDPGQFLESRTWVVVAVLSILVGIILMGILLIFVYNRKIYQLYKLQNNFINNFTHELKTPVTSLRLFLETFRKYELSAEDRRKYLDFMIYDVERLSDNINRILKLAKIESKAYRAKFRETDLAAAIRRLTDKKSPVTGNHVIKVHDPPVEPFSCRVDRPLFDILVMNLVTNAIKYNKSDVPRIDILFSKNKRHLFIRFEDNGIGVEPGEIKKIFRRFYRIGRTGDMTTKGSGLGLNLVQNIARIHKGRVTAENRENNNGSIFTLRLPYLKLETLQGKRS
ncbi:MAG: HAMP domain-containing histidine kinase [Desulfobacterales bacterium]|nr:HAMP domain-containing histidine kinase [Desulfobacterales bacterium]